MREKQPFGLTISGNLMWRPSDNLTLDAALFANDSALTTAAPGFEETDTNSLPNIAKIGGRASFVWTRPLSDAINFKLDGTVRYVGSSRLGTSPPLILEQGETVQVDLSAAINSGAWQITLDAANMMNISGNSFSYGNPFTVALRQQITPLRPRTIRQGIKIGF
jgi:iron complex outermembrane recepter protein